MTQDTEAIVAGDYVRLEPTRDVWKVLRVSDGVALLSPSSITLAGRPRRRADVDRLEVVRGASTGLPDVDELF